ncbi:hypothetical protein WA1_43460 [Scytonema hofmannii PCC 7110]|uniref:Uncharacterized protein n=1 Tax=Scytonema hofmannii PCC 7110 TaxID=128403 RepID=A0A139WVU5_9CYAN|nr:hypothetical protein [Scytonema hofmannii]KYC36549.1 hypothetical protein WA1_43460 [Scytonema hofmannii PCC 7110]
MEFKLSAARLKELAQIEEEANCDIGVGFDWGQKLGDYLLSTHYLIDQAKLITMLHEGLGNVLSTQELEELAIRFQEDLRNRVVAKLQSIESV